MAEKTITVDSMDTMLSLFGSYDENVNLIQREYNVVVLGRGEDIKVTGDEQGVFNACEAINGLITMINKGEKLSEQTIRYVFALVREGRQYELQNLSDDGICVTITGKVIKPKTLGQKRYVDFIRKNTIVLGIGPAGTGKTYLAVAMAVKAFKAHEVEKIILTRPAVEAGEKLGFLPGDLQNKVDPYLRPLYDALFEMLGPESFARQQERGCIEVAPLAYMRGRTLDNAFIILDEAQNTTNEQMKMFLTRLGFNSKIVITGDITQIDLPDNRRSGLIQAMNVLKDVEDIKINRFSDKDVVRHKLVQDIILAYEKYSKRNGKNNGQS
ncbi:MULTISPECIES: PhoH family protein [Ruminococcus]|uniref:PhoH-like protein n=1 Tax=Ruminococcus albus 8 TaxID=246199 RepID=E9SI00_RUMAL|nr:MULTISPECIES: PhoH family protein [Ruminococcus]MBE6872912.1 PhoH family protein [Ruminococcus albus]EGC01091.1 PhoH-like protein [Ruminococcus albus 8]MBO5559758.1 PhoH family protein [Ruminococcus sp.]MBQ9541564.1 PhoH family protein [Ruminococcus sp.]MBR0530872.1 PhoH family protein [Ruminococcus sp.]